MAACGHFSDPETLRARRAWGQAGGVYCERLRILSGARPFRRHARRATSLASNVERFTEEIAADDEGLIAGPETGSGRPSRGLRLEGSEGEKAVSRPFLWPAISELSPLPALALGGQTFASGGERDAHDVESSACFAMRCSAGSRSSKPWASPSAAAKA
jgi:hypothetical protein